MQEKTTSIEHRASHVSSSRFGFTEGVSTAMMKEPAAIMSEKINQINAGEVTNKRVRVWSRGRATVFVEDLMKIKKRVVGYDNVETLKTRSRSALRPSLSTSFKAPSHDSYISVRL